MTTNLWRLSGANRIPIRCNVFRTLSTKKVKLTENEAEEIRIPVPWGHIAGKWWGNKDLPPIIAIHGWQDNANAFDMLIPLLNSQSVLAIDLPGHGNSSHLPEGRFYDFGDYVISIHRIVKYLDLKKLGFLTHSFGSVIGLVYASLFPNNVNCVISFECASSILLAFKRDISNSIGRGINAFLKIEQQKQENRQPAYKLSEIIEVFMTGSLGSINTPESAMILLKRGAYEVSQKPQKIKKPEKEEALPSSDSDLLALVTYEKDLAKSATPEKREKILQNLSHHIENWRRVKESLQKMNIHDDKYYAFRRDPSVKVQIFQIFNEDLFLEAVNNIKCPVLSIKAKNGFLHGSWEEIYALHMEIVKNNVSYFESHEIDGTHHAHVNSPENMAQIINQFMEKLKVFDFKASEATNLETLK